MFNQVFNIFRKEWLEIGRDYRSLLTLLFMALAFPAYIYFFINMGAQRSESDLDIRAALVNGDEAPNVIAFLEEQGVEFTRYETLDDAQENAKAGEALVVFDPAFARAFENSQTATISIYVNQKDDKAGGSARQVRRLLRAYENQVQNMRLIARGVSPSRVDVLDINDYDLTSSGRLSNLMAGLILYMFILTAFNGTLASAADLIAGEKERQTLQPLLTQPVTRSALVFGKWLTLASLGAGFCSLAFLFGGFLISRAPLAAAGVTFYLDWKTLALGAVSLSVLALFAASLQIFLAAQAKTYREAMTYLPWTALAPLAITFVPLFTDVDYGGLLSFVPVFNQTFVLRELLLEGFAPNAQYFGGIATTLLASGLMLWLTMQRFGSEKSMAQS